VNGYKKEDLTAKGAKEQHHIIDDNQPPQKSLIYKMVDTCGGEFEAKTESVATE